MLRIVPHTVPRVGRSYEHFPDGFELHLLPDGLQASSGDPSDEEAGESEEGEVEGYLAHKKTPTP